MSFASSSGDFVVKNVNLGGGRAALTLFEATRLLLEIAPPQISIDDLSFFEGDIGVMDVVLTVSVGESTVPITVDYATADDSATTADNDYTASTGTLTFSPGDTSKTITVAVNGDTAAEQDETFLVNLSNAVNAAILDNQGVGTIENDDPRFIVNDIKVPEGNGGSTDAVFTIALSTPVAGQVTVDVATANGSGGEFAGIVSYWPGEGDGNDLVGGRHGTVQGTTTFAPGQVGQAFSFDGSAGGNVHMPDPGPVGASGNLDLTARATLTGWIFPASGITGQAIIINKESTYETALNTGTGTLQWAFQQAGGPGWVWVETGLPLPLNRWTFYAMTYENGKVRTYDESGTLFAPFDPVTELPLVNNDTDFRIGARGGDALTGSYWTGRLDEIRIYDVLLDVEEIQQVASGAGVGAAFAPIDYVAQSSAATLNC